VKLVSLRRNNCCLHLIFKRLMIYGSGLFGRCYVQDVVFDPLEKWI